MGQTVTKTRIAKNPTIKIASIILGILIVSVSCLMLSKSAKELVSTFQLNQQLKSERSNLKVLETKQGELALEKAKLQDPTYVQNYARGKHLLSKSEEQVFILPKTE